MKIGWKAGRMEGDLTWIEIHWLSDIVKAQLLEAPSVLRDKNPQGIRVFER